MDYLKILSTFAVRYPCRDRIKEISSLTALMYCTTDGRSGLFFFTLTLNTMTISQLILSECACFAEHEAGNGLDLELGRNENQEFTFYYEELEIEMSCTITVKEATFAGYNEPPAYQQIDIGDIDFTARPIA